MKNKGFIILVIVLLILVMAGLILYKIAFDKNDEVVKNETIEFKTIFSDSKVIINKYYIYGKHYNFEGEIKLDNLYLNNSYKCYLVIKNNTSEEEINIDFKHDLKNNILTFKTSDIINQGINLEKIDVGEYKFYLKIQDKINYTITYYSMSNNTEDEDLEYYTITKEGKNNNIKIYFDEENLNLSCQKCDLPDYVYDIVIDQGHGGGSAKGAVENGYVEAEVNYDIGIKLKEELEKIGLKVLVTREEKYEYVSEYGDYGRAVMPHKAKAKYCLSIHNNFSDNKERKGVEIYAPKFADLTFAKRLADSIVNEASSSYSVNTVGKVDEGVYVLTFSQEDVDSTKEEAINRGYEPYNVTTDTMYFFMIREVGGRLTGGYVDGRDKRLAANPYWNSNNVAESYLLELGYVSNIEDINNVVDNMDSYVSAIVKEVKKEIET